MPGPRKKARDGGVFPDYPAPVVRGSDTDTE